MRKSRRHCNYATTRPRSPLLSPPYLVQRLKPFGHPPTGHVVRGIVVAQRGGQDTSATKGSVALMVPCRLAGILRIDRKFIQPLFKIV